MQSRFNVHLQGIITLCIATLIAVIVQAQTSTPQNARRPVGELVVSRGATINNRAALAGETLFGGSRISTGKSGSAVLSLGKNGRIDLGADSDLVLSSSMLTVTGRLSAGRLRISTPAGSNLTIATARGNVTIDPRQSAIISITDDRDNLRVTSIIGESRISSGSRSERIPAGEQFIVSSSEWKRQIASREMLAAAASLNELTGIQKMQNVVSVTNLSGLGAANALNLPSSSMQRVVTTGNIINLFNTSVGISRALTLQPGTDRSTDVERFFDTTIICRDIDSPICRRRIIPTSGVNP